MPETPKIRYGKAEVPVIRKCWSSSGQVPYRKTYNLKPGQKWIEADVTEKQSERYVVETDGTNIPVGAKIAQDLMDEGAAQAVFVELWGGCVFVDHTLTCVEPHERIREIVESAREHNGGRLAGFPDVIAVFPDGRIALREAKCVDARDRLSRQQHDLADLLRDLFGSALDLAVVEWGSSVEES